MSYAIETQGLSVAYDARPVLWDVNAQVPKLSMTGIVGPNGAGKSTLIKAVLGLIPKVSGAVQAESEIAYVPQRSQVDWDFPITVFDVVLMGTYGRLNWFLRPGKKEKRKAWESIERVGLQDFANRQIGQLSGGQQQRCFIARALAQDPRVFLMDEPFAGVDAKTEESLVSLLRSQREEGKTVVAVHHDLSTVEKYFDHVLLLNRRLIACGDVMTAWTRNNIDRTFAIESCLSA